LTTGTDGCDRRRPLRTAGGGGQQAVARGVQREQQEIVQQDGGQEPGQHHRPRRPARRTDGRPRPRRSGADAADSRALVAALFEVAVANLAAAPQSPMDRPGWRDLLHAVVRDYHGEDTAAALGVPDSPLTPVLPLLAAGEAKVRHHQLQVPAAPQQAEEAGIDARRGLLATLTDSTAYQDHVAAS
jgi:hypothetical protein